MNIFDALQRAKDRKPEQDVLIFKGQHTSYRELWEQACRLGGVFRSRFNVQPGSRVAIFLPNIPEFLVSYYGTQKIGAVAVSLNVMLKRSEVEFILRDSGAQVLITTPQLLENVPENVALSRGIVTVGETGRSDYLSFADAVSDSSRSEMPTVTLAPDDGAAILYTSGTTGEPKGVLLTHSNLLSNIQATNRHTRMSSDDRLLCYLPLFHCFGQNFIMNAGVNAGATIILHERFVPSEVLESAKTNRASMFFGVPAVYLRLLTQPGIESYLETIRYYFSAAAPMPVEVVRKWCERFGQTIYEGYGLTETSPFATYNHDFDYREGSVGTPIENVEVNIVDENGRKVPPGEIGEVAIKGPNVMRGYFNRPQETAQVIRSGWFLTGDIGRMDKDGYLYLVDRAKDMINVSGFKIWPREVEQVLSTHVGVSESAAIGVPDPVSGEAVKAFVVLKESVRLSQQEVIDYCRSRMAVYKAPRAVEFIDSLPRNPSGKVLKRELRLRGSS